MKTQLVLSILFIFAGSFVLGSNELIAKKKFPKRDVSKKNPYGPAFPELKPLVVDDRLTGHEKLLADCKVRKLIIDRLLIKCKMIGTKRLRKNSRGYLIDGDRVIAVGKIAKRKSRKRSTYFLRIVEESPNIIDFQQSGYNVIFIDKKATDREAALLDPNKIFVNPLITLDAVGGTSNAYLQNLVIGEKLNPKTSLTGYAAELFLPYMEETAFFNWLGYRTTQLSGTSDPFEVEYEEGSSQNNFEGTTDTVESSSAFKFQPHLSPNQPLTASLSYVLSQKEKATVNLEYPEQNTKQEVELESNLKGIELEASAKLFDMSNLGFGIMLPSKGDISASDQGSGSKKFELSYQHFWLQGGVEQKFGEGGNFHYRVLAKYQKSTYTVSGEELNTKEYEKDHLLLTIGFGFTL